MKPVFYKKLVPLAMIASMAVSNLSVVAEAAEVKPAASGAVAVEETAVDEIEVPDIAASEIKVYAEDNEVTEPKLSIDAEDKTLTGTFLTSDEDTEAKDFSLTFNVTGDFDPDKFTLVSDTKDTALATGITVKTEPKLADGKVTATVSIPKSVKTGAKILLKGEAVAQAAQGTEGDDDYVAPVESKTVYSDAYSYTKVENKVSTAIAPKETTAKIKYDVFDPDDTSRDVTLTFTLTKDASVKKIDTKKLGLVTLTTTGEGDDAKTEQKDLDKSIKAKYTINSDLTEITVTASIPKSYMDDTNAVKAFALTYKESNTSTITSSGVVTVSTDTAGYLGKEDKGTELKDNKITGYYGTATDIVISDANINGIATGAFKDNKTIKSVKCSHRADLNVDAKAFENCPNLVLIDLGGANDTSTFNEEAIVNCEKAFVRTEQSPNGVLATALKKIKNPVINASTIATVDASGETITKAGDILKANLLAEMVIYNDAMYQMKKSDLDAAKPTPEQLAKAKWVVYDINKSTDTKSVASSAAKFSNGVLNAKTKQLTYSSSNTTGEVALIGNLKSAGAFNSAVRLVAQIPTFKEDGKTIEKYTDYAEFSFYVNPQEATAFKTVKDVTGKFEASKKEDEENVYTLTVAENASYKIPLALADGQNKALNYEADYTGGEAGSFTVVNGVVKGLKASATAGTIKVQAQDGSAEATVKVVVTQATKGLKSNVTLLSMAKNLTQSFTVAPISDSAEITAKVSYDDKTYTLMNGNKEVDPGDVKINGAEEFTIEFKSGKAPTDKKDFKGDMTNVTFTYKKGTKDATLKIKLAYATAPTDAKSIKQTAKKPKNGNTVNVSVPVGGIYNLGVSVAPATAQNMLNWQMKDSDGSWKAVTSSEIEIKGGVIIANAKTTSPITVRAVAATNENLTSYEYVINTYEAASSITWDAGATYKLRGGYLVGSDIETTCKKELSAGDVITFNAPTTTGSENIIWTANKPGSVFIDVTGGMMTIKPLAKGTYTITGVTEYTKQKMSFKISVGDEPENSTTNSKDNDALKHKKANTAEAWSNSATITANVGDTFQFGYDSEVTGTAPTFASSDAKVAAVNKTTGLVTIKKAGEAVISVGEKKVTITVNAAAADAKLKVPTFVQAGKEFAATTALKDVTWYYVAKDDTAVTKLDAGTGKNKYKLPATEGEYTLYVWSGKEEPANAEALKDTPSATINVYDVVATKAAVLDPWEWVTPDGATDKTFGSLKDMANTKAGFGIEQGYGFVLPVTATGLTDGKTVKASGNPNEIIWTSSNSNIAWVDISTVASDDNNNNIYGKYTVMTSTDYTGKVTLTGTLVNSGKKVKITLNVTPKTVTAEKE